MASKAPAIWERIAGLSELMTAVRNSLAELGDEDHPYTNLRRANLQATIMTVQRELGIARQSLQGARELDSAAETFARLTEGRLATSSGQTRNRAQQTLDRTIAPDAVKAILTAVIAKAKNRKPGE